MPVGIDSSVLCLWLNPQARPPLDPQTGQPVARAAERVAELCRQLLEQREAIIVPAPVVAEVLSAASLAADAVQSAIDRLFGLRVEPFDLKAAIELARLTRDVLVDRDVAEKEPRQKVKVDWQILAVLAVHGVHTLYTDDRAMARRAQACNMRAIGVAELPLPPEQMTLPLA